MTDPADPAPGNDLRLIGPHWTFIVQLHGDSTDAPEGLAAVQHRRFISLAFEASGDNVRP
jgi:hypothetical protein